DLTAALKLDPKSAVAHENRWVALSRMGKADAAQDDWDEYLKLVPNNQAYLQGLKDKLLPIYKQYPDPKTTNDFVTRGGMFYAAGCYMQAAGDYRHAGVLDEFNADAFYDLGLALGNLSYYDAAI